MGGFIQSPTFEAPDVIGGLTRGVQAIGALRQIQTQQARQAQQQQLRELLQTGAALTPQNLAGAGAVDAAKDLQLKQQQQKVNEFDQLNKIIGSNLSAGRLSEAQTVANFFVQSNPDLADQIIKLDGLEIPVDDGIVKTEILTDLQTGKPVGVAFNKRGKVVAIEGEAPTGETPLAGLTRLKETPRQAAIKAAATAVARQAALLPLERQKRIEQNVGKPQFGQALTAVAAASSAIDALERDPNIFKNFLGRAAGVGKAGTFENDVQEALLLTIFAQSGKQVTNEERKAFGKIFVPKFFQDERNARIKLQKMRLIANLSVQLTLAPENAEQIAKDIVETRRELGLKPGSLESAVEFGEKTFDKREEARAQIEAALGHKMTPEQLEKFNRRVGK
jgi:hypothetical protein